jgi:hypothetical protein
MEIISTNQLRNEQVCLPSFFPLTKSPILILTLTQEINLQGQALVNMEGVAVNGEASSDSCGSVD